LPSRRQDPQRERYDGEDRERTRMATLTVDPILYQQACEAAAAQGKTIEVFVEETLRRGAGETTPDSRASASDRTPGCPRL
jgi:predicted HicB family RNase H-like nuclease